MMSRPPTSRPRGQCRYDKSPRGCLAGSSCKFLHGEETISPFDQAKTCRFYAAGYCKRGASCWFKHVPSDAASLPPAAADDYCGICLDTSVTFGLLSDCGHAFCLECIRNWRSQKSNHDDYAETLTNKRCPYCRTLSSFVIPSSHYYPHGHPSKDAALERYKDSVRKVHCRYFRASPPEDRFCPFGRDCLFKHENADGSTYVFPKGVSHYMSQRQRRQNEQTNPASLTPRDGLRDFFNGVRTILDSIRFPAAARDVGGPASAAGEETFPISTEHLLEVLAAAELAVGDLWLTESEHAPSPTVPLIPQAPSPVPPVADSVVADPDAADSDNEPMPALDEASVSGIDSNSDDEHQFTESSTRPSDSREEMPSPGGSSSLDSIHMHDSAAESPDTGDTQATTTTSTTLWDMTSDILPSLYPDDTDDMLPGPAPASAMNDEANSCALPVVGLPPEPPFMTDGRGRVVWSRTGAKDGATEARLDMT